MWSTGPVPTRLSHALGAAESTLYWHLNPNSNTDIPPELTHRDNVRLTRHLYGRQTLSGEIIFGGDRQLTDNKTPDKAGIEANRNHVIEIFPFLHQFPDQTNLGRTDAFHPKSGTHYWKDPTIRKPLYGYRFKLLWF